MAIIAAVDFSPIASRAAGVAQHWAERLGEQLILVHVVAPPAALPQEVSAGLSVFTQALREAGEQQLAKVKKGLAEKGVEIATKVLFGKPETELVEFARANAASLMVVGTHGRSGAARFFLGSVAERVVKYAGCPVLVVPEAALEGLVERPKTEAMHIIAALSTGPAGEAVRGWLRQLREHEPCDVTFVHVFDAEAEHARLGIEGPYDDLGDDPELLTVLRREFKPLIQLPGAGKTALVLRSSWGKRPDPLAFEAATDEADLIVLGVGGKRHLGAGTGLFTLRAANVPVLCVPSRAPDVTEVDAGIPPLTRVLVPTDFSELSRRAIAHAYQLLRAGGGRVELCHVVAAPIEGFPPEKEAEIKQQLEGLVPLEAELRGIRTRVSVITSASPRDAIVQAAERLGADMIVLASHGRGGLSRAVLGSVADAVVRASPRPVVVVGPVNHNTKNNT